MKFTRTHLPFYLAVTLCLLPSCQAASEPSSSCSPLGLSKGELVELKTNGFDVKEASPLALALVDCLGDPDPKIRDGIAYEAMTTWLRGGAMTEPQLKALEAKLMSALRNPDIDGFRAPFAALVLSEVARVDRISPYLTDAERSTSVQNAANYLRSISDYRGFDDDEGWRHGVAHSADWVMQLALNKNVSHEDLLLIREAVAAQITPPGHAYIHGESERLARPILFMGMRDGFTEEEWTTWFEDRIKPVPLNDWGEAFGSETGLAKIHNTKAFLNTLYVNASASSNENIKKLLPGLTAALQSLP